jgi:opacity protein-like surface antigen
MGLDGITGTLSGSMTMHQLNIPLLIRMQASDNLSIMAGPYLSYRMSLGFGYNDEVKNLIEGGAADEAGVDLEDIPDIKGTAKDLLNDNLGKLDLGLTLGAEYAFDNGLFVDLRYNLGLMNHLKSDYKIVIEGQTVDEGSWKENMGVEPKMKHSTFQIGVGYRF